MRPNLDSLTPKKTDAKIPRTGCSYRHNYTSLGKISLILFILANLSFSAFSQTKTGKIEGTIGDEARKPLQSATISLLQVGDSSLVSQTISDKSGHFQFNDIPVGQYRVKASVVGRSSAWSPVFDLSAPNF